MMFTLAYSSVVSPIFLWPPGRQYCLVATILQGVGRDMGVSDMPPQNGLQNPYLEVKLPRSGL